MTLLSGPIATDVAPSIVQAPHQRVTDASAYGVVTRAARPRHRGIGQTSILADITRDYIASFIIALRVLFTVDSFIGCTMTGVLTYFYWEQRFDDDGEIRTSRLHSIKMDWQVLSMAVVFPISVCISQAFTRREKALTELNGLLSTIKHLHASVVNWRAKASDGQWVTLLSLLGPSGRDDLHHLLGQLLRSLIEYLNLPRTSHARHVVGLCGGATEHSELNDALREQKLLVDSGINGMQRLVQELKQRGLPGGEAHRLDQYVSMCSRHLEALGGLKEYRTPQIFRAFARVWICVFGSLYAPYYVWMAVESDSFAIAISFAMVMQVTVSALFNVLLGLENPFSGGGGLVASASFDGVRVAALVEVTRRQMLRAEEEAALGWAAPLVREEWTRKRPPRSAGDADEIEVDVTALK